VGRGEELGLLLVVGPAARKRAAARRQLQRMDEEVDRLADEGVAGVFAAEQLVAVDAESTGGGGTAGRGGGLGGLQGLADRVEVVGVGALGYEDGGGGRDQVRVAAQVVVGEGVVPAEGAVVAAEPVTPVVAHPALLGPPGGRLQDPGVGLDAEVPVAEV